MEKFENNALWQNTLGKQGDRNVERLRNAYLSFRENMKGLLDEVRSDFPNLTVHDINHTDELWRIASLITGPEYPINPLEGFILGCSFLVHDSILSYKAYGGKDALRNTIEWKDYYADIINTEYDTEDGKKRIDFKVIRKLHARGCSEILNKQFESLDNQKNYLLSDEEMRKHYGGIIGLIAESHHWETSRLTELPPQINALAIFPEEWTINPLKLACILRCADAAAIDMGRAPDYIFRLLRLNGVSKDHWIAQNKLTIALDNVDQNLLLISSTSDFEEKDFSAWNVAYDAVKVIESELDKCLNLLSDNVKFKVKGVSGAKSRMTLAKYIRTKGWVPNELSIHVSDVAKLITTLGGRELYGNEDILLIVLRELIQNARDSINARRKLEGEDNFEGKISIEVKKSDKGTELIVTDNGVGMSVETISNSLLNFGHSLWHENEACDEFPGLKHSGFRPVGQFGIGFFSVFMVAKSVVVDTRKYIDGLDNANLVKFPDGLTLNPIFAKHRSKSTGYSTSISILLDEKHSNWPVDYEVKSNKTTEKNFKVPMAAMLSSLVAALDVDVFYKEFEENKGQIHLRIDSANLDKKQWLRDLSFADYRKDKSLDEYIENNYQRLKYIYDENGSFCGLAAISSRFQQTNDFLSGSTVGGLLSIIHSRSSEYYLGILEHRPGGAKRTCGEYKASETILQEWAKDQVSNLGENEMFDKQLRLRLQIIMQYFNIDPKKIAIGLFYVRESSIVMKTFALRDLVQNLKNGIKILFVDSELISNKEYEGHFDSYIDVNKIALMLNSNEFLYIPLFNSNFLTYKIVDGVPERNFGIIDCLYREANEFGYEIKFSYRNNYTKNIFGIPERALVVEIK